MRLAPLFAAALFAAITAAGTGPSLAAHTTQQQQTKNERREHRQELRNEKRENRQQNRNNAREQRQQNRRNHIQNDARRNRVEHRQDVRNNRIEHRQNARNTHVERRQNARNDRIEHRQQVNNKRYNWRQYRRGHRPANLSLYRRNFDRRAWQRAYHASHRYHWNAYVRPHGWYYRRWTYGERLPFLFWTDNYWIDSYWDFGLTNPPYGFVWVRYGDDALLVDVETGEILQVEYDVFY